MIESEVNVYIEQRLDIPVGEDWFRDVAQKTLDAEGIAPPVEMGLVITDTETVQQLNKTYRDEDEPTDVLAFHMLPDIDQEHGLSFVAPPDGICHLGEVVISYPQAVKQALKQGCRVEQELALLTVHGVLHLLNYDHEQLEERRRMKAKEEEILRKLGPVAN